LILNHVIKHGVFYGVITTAYLFLLMISVGPRVWGYSDYPQAVKDKVPPQTPKEKRLAAILGAPWLVFVLGFPVFSTLALRFKLGGEIAFWTAFFNLAVMFALATIGDLVILDWLIISRITPAFVVIPGSEAADYKDFSHHFKGHARAAIIMILIGLALAAVVSSF
jgi:hypothetical protein